MERTDSFIKVWFWSRDATGIPSDVMNGETTVNTGNWVSDLIGSCGFGLTNARQNREHRGRISLILVVLFLPCLDLIISSSTVCPFILHVWGAR